MSSQKCLVLQSVQIYQSSVTSDSVAGPGLTGPADWRVGENLDDSDMDVIVDAPPLAPVVVPPHPEEVAEEALRPTHFDIPEEKRYYFFLGQPVRKGPFHMKSTCFSIVIQ